MVKRIVGWVVLVPLCVLLILFALANRQLVIVNFNPFMPPGTLTQPGYGVPLFLVIYIVLLLGVIAGGIATWFAQGKVRQEKRHWRKEAETLRGRIQTCDEANALFKSMQNAAIRDAVVKTSADMPPALRELLDKTPIGHLTEPEVTKQGVEMVALCSRKPTTVDTPRKKEIRDKMYNDKFEAKSNAYLQQIRKAAMIEYRH